MPDRTINFGDSETDARYRIQDTSSTGGDFVLAEDLDGGTVLLEYDYSASEWVSRGPVNLSGNDITNAGAVSADSLEAETTTIGSSVRYVSSDAELDTAISESTDNDTIYLLPNEYTVDRTINTRLIFRGSVTDAAGSRISATWTIDSECAFYSIAGDGDTNIQCNIVTAIHNSGFFGTSKILFDANRCRFVGNNGGDVTFAANTNSGIVDACVDTTVTDNGTNKVRDIS